MCSNSSECFDETLEIQKLCSVEISKTPECICTPYIGWDGELCNQLSPLLVYNRIISLFFLFCGILTLILISRTLLLNLIAKGPFEAIQDPLFRTLLLIYIGAILLFAFVCLKLQSYFNPSTFEIIPLSSFYKEDIETVSLSFTKTQLTLLTFSYTIGNLGIISLVWTFKGLLNIENDYQDNYQDMNLDFWIVFMKMLNIVYISILFLLILFKENEIDALLLTIISSLILSLTFPIILKKYSEILIFNSDLHVSSVHRRMILLKNVLTKVSTCMLGIAFIYSLLLVTANHIVYLSDPKQTKLAVVLNDIIYVLYSYIYLVIAWYVNSTTEGVILSDLYPKLCSIFSLWDQTNQDIFPEELEEHEIRRFASKVY